MALILMGMEVLEEAPKISLNTHRRWKCKCSCGNITIVYDYNLIRKTKLSKTCGYCAWHIKHPEAYSSWRSMKRRCDDINFIPYPRYGGRGIIHWNSFQEFIKDMGDPPTDRITGDAYTLDRIDGSKGYSKENCRWADKVTQSYNRRKFYRT